MNNNSDRILSKHILKVTHFKMNAINGMQKPNF